MFSSVLKYGTAFALTLSLCLSSLAQPFAYAAVIGTLEAMDLEERSARIDHVNTLLARQEVRAALVDLGVDPANAVERVESLTDAELQMLEARLDELPAGGTGLIGVVGIVAIVLVILELLDVTDIFTKI